MTIIRRSQWGARAPKNVSHDFTPYKGGVALHYEGPKLGSFGHVECYNKIRQIQKFHMDTRGWADIAYSFLVCPHGGIFECRGLGVRTAAQGTNEGNDNYYAICVLMGEGDPLTSNAKSSVLDAIDYVRHWGHAGSSIKLHKQFHSTGCPGSAIEAWWKGGLHDPSPAPHAATPATHPAHTYPVPTRVLRFDPKHPKDFPHGEDVKWVQDKVNRFYHKTVLSVDGDYGKLSAAWVKAYQKHIGILADGVTGPDTVRHLKRIP